MTTFADAIADVKNGPVSHPLYNVVEIAFKAVWTIRDAAAIRRTLRKAEASRYDYLGDPWEAIGDELYSEDFAELRGWLQTTVAEYRRILRASRGSNLPDVKSAKPRPVAEPVTHYVKGREKGKRNFVFVAPNGESRLKVHAARFTATAARAALAELATENPDWEFKAVRIDGSKSGVILPPAPVKPSPVKVAAMAPARPVPPVADTIRPVDGVAGLQLTTLVACLSAYLELSLAETDPADYAAWFWAMNPMAREEFAELSRRVECGHRGDGHDYGPVQWEKFVALCRDGQPVTFPTRPVADPAPRTERQALADGIRDYRRERREERAMEDTASNEDILSGKATVRYCGEEAHKAWLSASRKISRRVFLRRRDREERESSARIRAKVAAMFKDMPFQTPAPVAESATATPENAGHTETAAIVEPTPIPADTAKSVGHLAFYGTHEYFERSGAVSSAPTGNPVMPDGYRCGRFECQAWAWPRHSEHLRATFGIPPVIETDPLSGGSPELAVDLPPGFPESVSPLSPGFPESATLPTVEIKGAAYTTEAIPNGLAFIKLVNGNRHEATWTEDGVADCTCEGFRYRGECRHLEHCLKAGLIPSPAPVPVLPEPAPSDPCDIRPGHPEHTAEDAHARVRAIIVGAPILVYHLPESGARRVDTLGWVVADHVSRLLEIQRDGQHGRDDSAGVGWTASLLWDAMPAEDREHFAEWVDAIGYDPTEDFAGLPTEEQWDVFAECCITGTPIRTIPPGSDPGPGADATIFADQSRDFVASVATPAPSPEIFFGCNARIGNDLRPSPCPPPEVFASDPIISRAPLDAIDLVGAHAMNTLPALSGGSPEDDESHPWGFCYGCRQIRPLAIGTGFRLATHADRSGVKCGGSGSKAGYICSRPDDEATPPISGGATELPELPEDCPCPECGGSGVAGGQFTEGGEETSPCTLCEGTGRYSPTELPEEEYDRLVAAATPSNETLRRMIRDRKPTEDPRPRTEHERMHRFRLLHDQATDPAERDRLRDALTIGEKATGITFEQAANPKPPEATAPPDRLVEDLEGWASVMGGPRDLIPAERDDVIVALREAAEEIRRLRARDATLGASCKSWLNAILVHSRHHHRGGMDGYLWQSAKELRETIKAVEPDWVEPEPKP